MSSFISRKISTSVTVLARRIQGPSAVSGHADGGYRIYKCIALFVAFPLIGVLMANCYFGELEKEKQERHPFVKYEYLRRRTKRFPWGEGNKSLFHNPHTNPLPDGYEEDEED